MKIQDLATNDSSFIELNLNEATDVCGGGPGWSPMDFENSLTDSLDGFSSIMAYNLRRYPNTYAPRFNSSDLDGINRYVNGSLAPLRMNGINIPGL
jgi:hypothetical protein